MISEQYHRINSREIRSHNLIKGVVGLFAVGFLGLSLYLASPVSSKGMEASPVSRSVHVANEQLITDIEALIEPDGTTETVTTITGEYIPAQELPVCNPESERVYVDDSAEGLNNGSGWQDAYTDLQDALSYISQHQEKNEEGETDSWEAWVAEGTYKPTDEADRSAYFLLGQCMKLYGGFSGTETKVHQRDSDTNTTILSGEIGESQIVEDNSEMIVRMEPLTTADTKIDGFTITGGYSEEFMDGPMFMTFSAAVIQNIMLSGNVSKDGGMINLNGAVPFINNVTITENAGNGIYGGPSTPDLFEGYNFALVNSVIANNIDGKCLVLINGFHNPSFMVNSVCTGNTEQQAAIRNAMSVLVVNNTVVWGNTVPVAIDNDPGFESIISYSAIQGGYDGEGNFSRDPLFIDKMGHVPFFSPLVDAGNDDLMPRDLGDIDYDGDTAEIMPYDADRNTRVQNVIDIGAYETAKYEVFLAKISK